MEPAPPLPPPSSRGNPIPWVPGRLLGRPEAFNLNQMGGRHLLLLFFGSAAHPAGAEALRLVDAQAEMFDDERALFFGFSIDPADVAEGRIANRPGMRFFDDRDRASSLAFGVVDQAQGSTSVQPAWVVVDPMLRVIGRFPLAQGEAAIATLREALDAPPAPSFAPVLIVPNILELDFCRHLISLYEAHGGSESGFMRNVDGRTVGINDHSIKRRKDYGFENDEATKNAFQQRIVGRLLPMIHRAFAFRVTRIERYIVACYDAADGGHFRRHRDNTTPGTAHRRFAVTINLNGEYEGGDLTFPEFGTQTYRAPPGGAVVFSCSLLHEAQKVTAGRRYATLPFLYDDAAARIREANWHSLAEKTGEYRAFAEPAAPIAAE